MIHTEKDCVNVSDEDKETGYGWGMDFKDSPRKGFNKNKEEVEALKFKKKLFVTKPSLVTDSTHSKESSSFVSKNYDVEDDTACGVGPKMLNLIEKSPCEDAGQDNTLKGNDVATTHVKSGLDSVVLCPTLHEERHVEVINVNTEVVVHNDLPS